jgi:hypothetical protein
MFLPVALSLLDAAAQPAMPQADNENPSSPVSGVAIMCDSTKFRFSIRAAATSADLDKSFPITKIVTIDDLFYAEGLPGWTGETDIMGPLIRYERCGPYTFKLQGAAYNLNVQGESGAYEPFASVTILRGAGVLYPDDGGVLRLTDCDRMLPRARPCPDGYAVRLDGQYDGKAKALHMVETSISFEDDSDAKRTTRVRHFDLQDDLEMWRPD